MEALSMRYPLSISKVVLRSGLADSRGSNLGAAIEQAEKLRRSQKSWPPVNSGTHRQARGLQGVMDEEMGFLD
jgi:beta-1,4-N-acetylglucosaminyltransferase